MKPFPVISLLLFSSLIFTTGLFGQQQDRWQHVDEKMSQIPRQHTRSIDHLGHYINTHFDTDVEKLRAMYYWLAHQIEYDLRPSSEPQSREEIIAKAFRTRRAVCEGYAGLMDTLSRMAGIPVHTIHGFTLQQGQIEDMAHAWIAAQLNGKWYLFDPTWGGGSFLNNRYRQQFDEEWFMVEPERMIQTHMPYDPLWQFLEKPVSYSEFAGRTARQLYERNFRFADSIALYQNQSKAEQLRHEERRIRMNRFRHPVISYRLDYIKEALRVYASNERIGLYNQAGAAFNQAVESYNAYANYRNRHRLDDASAANLINILVDALEQLDRASAWLNQMGRPPSDMAGPVRNLRTNIQQLRAQIDNEMRQIGSER